MQLPHQLSPKPRNFSSLLVNLIRIFSLLCIIYFFLTLFLFHSSTFVSFSSSENVYHPTSIEHVVFGIASNQDSWSKGKDYVKLWWRPDKMRGCVFVEKMPPNTPLQNDSDSLPPTCISEDTARFRYTYRGGPRSSVRIARVVSETVSLNHSNVRWFVFGEDDTVFFPENLVKTLSKYDHELWHYIGTNSESLTQNKFFSFDMAFGGAGFAISYPLARVLASVFDSCLERYPHIYGSDGRVHACIAELGIGMTHEPGFHQMDIRGNVFGLLAAHPNTPVVSLHNLDQTDPIFPNMTTTEALEHLLRTAKVDPHRLLQQTVCYDWWFSWTFSVSWGYAVQVFGNHMFLPDVLRTQQTFEPWRRGNPLAETFNFNTRDHHPDPCRRPTVFFFDRADFSGDGRIKSSYRRLIRENCTFDKFSPKKLDEIRVLSNKLELGIKQLQAPRRHCCDVSPPSAGKIVDIAIRECREDELINMHP